MPTVKFMREYLKSFYSKAFCNRVDSMSDAQVIAIFYRIQNDKKVSKR